MYHVVTIFATQPYIYTGFQSIALVVTYILNLANIPYLVTIPYKYPPVVDTLLETTVYVHLVVFYL